MSDTREKFVIRGRGADQFMVRMPEGLRDRLRQAAADNGRSMNAEIVLRLTESLDGDDRMARIEAKLDALLSSAALEGALDDRTEPA
jgi:hypothetical protein